MNPTNDDFCAADDLLTIVLIACAAVGVVALVFIFVFGEQFLNLIYGG